MRNTWPWRERLSLTRARAAPRAVGFDEETLRHTEGVARGIEGDDASECAEGSGVCAAVGMGCAGAEEGGAKAEEKDEKGAGHGRKSRWVKR